jgi:transcriptional regulator with XRE-family HTH domain
MRYRVVTMDQTSSNLAANVRRVREARDLTQRQLAELSGVPRPTLANIETGGSNPTLNVLVKVAGALGTSIEQLIGPPRSAARFYPRETLQLRSRGKVLVQELLVEPVPGLSVERAELPSGARVKAPGPGTSVRQYVSCEAGELEVAADGEVWRMGPGDVMVTRGEVGHVVSNRGRRRAIVYLVTTRAPSGA